MDREDLTLQALTERLEEAEGPDPDIAQAICEAYILELATLGRHGKALTKLGRLAAMAAMKGTGSGATLQAAADSALLLPLVAAMEGIDRAVSDSYIAEYRQ